MEAAYYRLKSQAEQFDTDQDGLGVLFLTDASSSDGFSRLLSTGKSHSTSVDGTAEGWHARLTEENTSLFMSHEGKKLLVIAGKQIATRDRLEVLAVGTRQEFDDGASMEKTIENVARSGALPVVPWGAGKWSGSRRKQIETIISSSGLPRFFLGDNANRPKFWPKSSLFGRAEKKGIFDLPGSDPLPFVRESKRIGRGGFRWPEKLDEDRPAADLTSSLAACSEPPATFINYETPARFLRNQLAMQYRNAVT